MQATQYTTGNPARIASLIDLAIIEYAIMTPALAGVAAMLNGYAMMLTAWDARIMATLITEVAQSMAGAMQPLDEAGIDLAGTHETQLRPAA